MIVLPFTTNHTWQPASGNPSGLPEKRTTLYLATMLGYTDTARAEILRGADVNNRDPAEGRTVLETAVYKGHERIVNDLLMAGADPNTRTDWNRTPLHTAAIKGHSRIAAALVVSGGAVNALDGMGESPLIKAAHLGYQLVVEALLAAGADVNIRGTGPSRYSALDRAAQFGHVDVLETILGRGVRVNSADHRGVAAIHVAALHGEVRAVDALIDAGADMRLRDHRGWTPLLFAARWSNHGVLLTLLERGASAQVQSTTGTTPLHQACCGQRKGLEATVKLLLKRGSDKQALDEKRRTPVEMIDAHPDGEDGGGGTVPRENDGEEREEEEAEASVCPRDEINRVRGLLSPRPPASVAWRRRSWLVMLRSRLSKAKTAGDSSGNDTNDRTDAHVLPQKGKRQMIEGGRGAGGRGTRARVEVRGGGDDSGARGNGGNLNEVVDWLAETEREALFRAVLEFL